MTRSELIKEDILRSASVLLIVGILVAIMTLPGLIDPARVANSVFHARESSHNIRPATQQRKVALSSIVLERGSASHLPASSAR